MKKLNALQKHKAAVDNHNDPESFPSIGKKFRVIETLEKLPTCGDVYGGAMMCLSGGR